MWEPERALEDDERAAQAFLGLGILGVVSWFATLALAQSLLPASTIAALLAVVFAVVGWRAARQGLPREASTLVAVVLVLSLGALWLYLVLSVLLRLAS